MLAGLMRMLGLGRNARPAKAKTRPAKVKKMQLPGWAGRR